MMLLTSCQARPGCWPAAPTAVKSWKPQRHARAQPAVPHKQRSCIVRCDADKPKPTQGEVKGDESLSDSSILDVAKELQDVTGGQKKRRKADSTDPIATALTRRFGLAGGLAWLGFLAFGVISEQIKTRREVKEAEEGAQDVSGRQQLTTPSGLKYTDLRIGGGEQPRKGDLVVVDYTGRLADGTAIDDTRARGRPVAFVLAGQPSASICRGLEEGIATMRQGGRRKIVIPPALGFGQEDVVLPSGGRVPANSVLEYDVDLLRVSIAP